MCVILPDFWDPPGGSYGWAKLEVCAAWLTAGCGVLWLDIFANELWKGQGREDIRGRATKKTASAA